MQREEGLLAGALLGVLSLFSPDVVLGTLAGNIAAGKVDKQSHYLLTSSLITVAFLLGVRPTLFIIPIAVAAYLDEKVKKLRRMLLPVTLLVLIPLLGVNPLIYTVLFDSGFELARWILKKGY